MAFIESTVVPGTQLSELRSISFNSPQSNELDAGMFPTIQMRKTKEKNHVLKPHSVVSTRANAPESLSRSVFSTATQPSLKHSLTRT